jgi:hypothetical protein
MSSTIFASKKRKRPLNAKDEDSDVDNDFADDSSDEGGGHNDECEIHDEECDAEESINSSQGESFDIGETIALESKDLADVLSEKDLIPQRKVAKQAPPVEIASQKVLTDDDWDM